MPPSSDPAANDLLVPDVGMGDTATPMLGLVLGILVVAVLVFNAFAY
jgi:hypothetical protein